jgi:hypothetical protein
VEDHKTTTRSPPATARQSSSAGKGQQHKKVGGGAGAGAGAGAGTAVSTSRDNTEAGRTASGGDVFSQLEVGGGWSGTESAGWD